MYVFMWPFHPRHYNFLQLLLYITRNHTEQEREKTTSQNSTSGHLKRYCAICPLTFQHYFVNLNSSTHYHYYDHYSSKVKSNLCCTWTTQPL